MPQLDGIEATRRVVALDGAAPVRVLMLTTFDLNEYVYEALRAGASGFLLKDVPPEQLAAGIRVVAQGEALLAPSITKRLIQEFAAAAPAAAKPPKGLDELTARELEVFKLIARGLSNAEIAAELIVSETTVKTHVARVLMKLGLRDRVQAVVLAYESGISVPGRAVRVKLVTWNVNSLERADAARARAARASTRPTSRCCRRRRPSRTRSRPAELRAAGYDVRAPLGGALGGRRGAGARRRSRTSAPASRASRRSTRRAGSRRRPPGCGSRSVYVPNGRAVGHPEYAKKLAFLDAARERIGTLDVLAGDFNVCPADIDVYDPAAFAGSTHVQPEERARFAALLGRRPRRRVPLSSIPDEVGFTWWDYRQGHFHRKMGLRIDAFLVGAARWRSGSRSAGSTATTARARSHRTTRRCCWSSPDKPNIRPVA